MLDTLLKLDGDILLWIQDNLRAGWLDPIMKFITYLANGGALWIGICVLLLKTLRGGRGAQQDNRCTIGLLLSLGTFGSFLCSGGGNVHGDAEKIWRACTYSGNTHCVLTAVCWCTLSIRRYRRRSNGNDICCYNSSNIQKILQGQETF